MLSPFTQWAGLIGDKLAHKRELLRVQQEETLDAILCHAAPRLARLRPPIHPIPIKFLVPFLEYASLEEPDSDLVRMWANLLASSAELYSSDNVYYVRIISQLSSVQARLFEDIVGLRGPRSVLLSMEENYFLGNNFVLDRILEAFTKAKRVPKTVTGVWNAVARAVNMQGVVIEHIDIGHLHRADYLSGPPTYSIYKDDNQNDYAILRGLGLLEYVDTGYQEIMRTWKIKIMAHYVSPLGLSFAQACGVGAAPSS